MGGERIGVGQRQQAIRVSYMRVYDYAGEGRAMNRGLLGLRREGLQGVSCLQTPCISLYNEDKIFLRPENRVVDNLTFMYIVLQTGCFVGALYQRVGVDG